MIFARGELILLCYQHVARLSYEVGFIEPFQSKQNIRELELRLFDDREDYGVKEIFCFDEEQGNRCHSTQVEQTLVPK